MGNESVGIDSNTTSLEFTKVEAFGGQIGVKG
jgi:hypothetical protein